MKLYTKNGCVPCQRVKEYLITRPQLEVEIINCSDEPERVMEFSNYSKTFPTLVTEHGFVTNSEVILDFLSKLSDGGTSPKVEPFKNVETAATSTGPEVKNETGFNTEVVSKEETHKIFSLSSAPVSKLARIPEPDCEACQ